MLKNVNMYIIWVINLFLWAISTKNSKKSLLLSFKLKFSYGTAIYVVPIRYYVYTTTVASMKKSYGVVIEKYQSQYSPIKKFQSPK